MAGLPLRSRRTSSAGGRISPRRRTRTGRGCNRRRSRTMPGPRGARPWAGARGGGSAVSDGRTPAQIEADIVRRRQDLAATLDEIGVRVHPKTITNNARASVREAVDRTAGRAYVAVNRAVSDLRSGLVTDDGAPR